MLALLNSERIKLTSTRSPWWCAFAAFVLGVGIPAFVAWAVARAVSSGTAINVNVDASLALAGIVAGGFSLGLYVMMVAAVLVITTEYRFGIIRTTFQATPNRTKVLGAKVLLVGACAVVLTWAIAVLAFFVVKAILPAGESSRVVFSATTWRMFFGGGYYVLMCIALAIAVGTLLRHSAAAISLLILWPLVAESILGNIGSIGRNVKPFLPFANATHFFSADTPLNTSYWHWGPWGGMAYFTAFVVIVCAAAVYAVNNRDA